MGLELPERSIWAERALQGLAFWIGHRQAMFAGYPLPEAALVAEACNLLQGNLPKDLVLRCEQQYSRILPKLPQGSVLGNLDRADLIIAGQTIESALQADWTQHIEVIIEVKRAPARHPLIVRDLQRLLEALKLADRPTLRGWLFVVSESGRPEKFVGVKGKSKFGPHKIENTDGWYVVRRSCKASARFESTEEAHYACLLEVLREKPPRSRKRPSGL